MVGSRGRGAFQETLLGSTSSAVATHASCPVVVLPDVAAPASSEVVVGVDGSVESRPALHFAFEPASRNGNELVAVQALPTAQFIPGPYDHPDRDELLALAEQDLSTQVSAREDDFPGVAVRQVVSNIPPVRALRDAAQHARLLAVGHRGIGGFTGLLLGSVARGVLHHAPCPVATFSGFRGPDVHPHRDQHQWSTAALARARTSPSFGAWETFDPRPPLLGSHNEANTPVRRRSCMPKWARG